MIAIPHVHFRPPLAAITDHIKYLVTDMMTWVGYLTFESIKNIQFLCFWQMLRSMGIFPFSAYTPATCSRPVNITCDCCQHLNGTFRVVAVGMGYSATVTDQGSRLGHGKFPGDGTYLTSRYTTHLFSPLWCVLSKVLFQGVDFFVNTGIRICSYLAIFQKIPACFTI